MLGFAPIATTPLGAPSANEAFTLQAQSGTYTLSLQGAGKLITDIYPSGTYVLNGRAVGLSAQRPANFDAGSFTLEGQDITFDQGYGVIASNGSFTLTGNDVVFDTGFGLVTQSGEYTLTYQTVNIDISMAVGSGTFTLTGQGTPKGIGEAVQSNPYVVTYQDASVTAQRLMSAESASYSKVGYTVRFLGFISPNIPVAVYTEQTDAASSAFTEASDTGTPIWTEVA